MVKEDDKLEITVSRKYEESLPPGQAREEPETIFVDKFPFIHRVLGSITDELGVTADSDEGAVYCITFFVHDTLMRGRGLADKRVRECKTVLVSSSHNVKDVMQVIRDNSS